MTNDMEQVFKQLPADKAEHYKHVYNMLITAYEFGLNSQRVLIDAGIMADGERLFLTRKERRQLTGQV
jgi:hypothetical protein